VAVDYLNMLLRDEDDYWSDPRKLKSRIQHAFHFALQEEEISEAFNIRNDLILVDWERDPFLWPMVRDGMRDELFIYFILSSDIFYSAYVNDCFIFNLVCFIL
jgi:hypothetical protein